MCSLVGIWDMKNPAATFAAGVIDVSGGRRNRLQQLNIKPADL